MPVHGELVRGEQGPAPFSRLFPGLEPLVLDDETLRELADWMIRVEALDNPDIPAGFTYFGQFVVHDITFGVPSLSNSSPQRAAVANLRTPRLELDSLYDDGPLGSPHLYDRHRPGEFLLGAGDELDLQRNRQGTAILGDPRNDDNVIVSQMHASFARLHNLWMGQAGLGGEPWMEAFENARRRLQRHYQWMVLRDFLPRLVGNELVGEILPAGARPASERYKGRFFPLESEPLIPAEFAVAAFRVGHAMVRAEYFLNDQTARSGAIELFSSDPSSDLRGGRTLPTGWAVDWRRFFALDPEITPQASQVIGPRITKALSRLPDLEPCNLALRSLRRGQAYRLPSGQAVAWAMGEEPVRPDRQDPLWLYVLVEADELHGGRRMGPVGGRIVAEVIIGLLAADPQSFVNTEPEWMPEEGLRELGRLLAASTVVPGSAALSALRDIGPSWRDIGIPTAGKAGKTVIAVGRDGGRNVQRSEFMEEASR